MLTLVTLLVGCGGSAAPTQEPPAGASWAASVKPWYCGTESVTAASGASVTRDVIVKLSRTAESFTALYALQEDGRASIGTLTRFDSAEDRVATLRAENDLKQKVDAKVTFGPDFQTMTIEWSVGRLATQTSTVLTAVAEPASCAAGKLLR